MNACSKRTLPASGIAIALTLFVLLLSSALLSAAQFTASLDRPVFELGDQAKLILTFEGGEPAGPPGAPRVPGLQIAYAGQTSQAIFINGRASSTLSYSYGVTAQRVGEYTIPEMVVTVGGQQLKSQPLKLTVTQPGAVAMGNAGQSLAMMKLAVPRKEVFVGETFTLQLNLYLHSSVQNFGNFQLTSFPAAGFNVGKMAEGQRSRTQIGDAVYTVIPINLVLTPVKQDTLTIGPITARMIVELPSPNRRRDPFDAFLFNRPDQRTINLSAEPETLESKSLPVANLPPGFNGAIGQYSLSLSAGPTNVAVGDPITIKVQITGRGSLDSVSLPEQPEWAQFRLYPPTAKTETTDPLGVEGSRIFEQVVVPQSTDVSLLPQFSFSYFDPEIQSFQTLTHPPIPLTVRPAGSSPQPTLASADASETAVSEDIVPIRQRPGRLVAQQAPLLQRPAFLALQSVPLVALIGAVLWRRRHEAVANNPRLRRQRQVAETVRNGIATLKQHAAQNQSDDFFATVFRLLQEQLGERLDVPAHSITESVVQERLRPQGLPEETLRSVEELFQACNLARYAPIKSSQELAAFIPRVESALHALQEVKP
ncbi:MAG TPA: BatD family protein [Verrucomicrobiae bacterium]|nr:BatD family protein [Verrucomicrobiae bacterium]